MRRPSPLPPTGRATSAADSEPLPGADSQAPLSERPGDAGTEARAASEVAESPRTPASGAVATAEADPSIAPVIPLASPGSAQRPSGLASAMDVASPEDPVDEDPSRIGLREVWRAARARRRALRAEVRRFTVRQRRRRATWLGAAASIVVLVLVTLGAAYSPLFSVEKIHVEGTTQLKSGTVEAALAGQLGKPLPLVDESAVKAALVTFPLVESYSLEARPPHELVVRIVERTPVGVIRTAAGYNLVDAAGVVLSTTPDPVPASPLLSVSGGTHSPAFEAVGQVMRSLPAAIRSQVTAVAASTPDDVTLTLGGTHTQVVWGSADESALKALVLRSTMAARPPSGVSVYDVSSPRAVVVS